MPSSYPGRHMPLPSTSEKSWVSVANWATPVGFLLDCLIGLLVKLISVFQMFRTCTWVVGKTS
ncbi:hypothetical protein Hanom_Chr10g00958371 [Helianthus anomalus]